MDWLSVLAGYSVVNSRADYPNSIVLHAHILVSVILCMQEQ